MLQRDATRAGGPHRAAVGVALAAMLLAPSVLVAEEAAPPKAGRPDAGAHAASAASAGATPTPAREPSAVAVPVKAVPRASPRVPRPGTAPASATAKPGAATKAPHYAKLVPCDAPLAPPGKAGFEPGETLFYDLDIMGVRAGTLVLEVDRNGPDGLAFSAEAKSNTFFDNVRKVEGRATSYARDASLMPLRYREDATEDGVKKWAEVVFPTGPKGQREVDVRYAIGPRQRRVRYAVKTGPHDLLSLLYYVRTLDLSAGRTVCVDMYGNRKVWRVRGRVEGEEWVSTPAGKFKTWHVAGTAQRLDYPDYSKEVHLWFTDDARKVPVAAVGEIDLGPVRATLSRIGRNGGSDRAPDYGGGSW